MFVVRLDACPQAICSFAILSHFLRIYYNILARRIPATPNLTQDIWMNEAESRY